MIISFDNIQIDQANFQLLREGERLVAEPLLFDLLIYFVNNPQKLLSKDELMKAVWGGRIVSDATIASAVKNVRKLIGDSGQKQHCIKTVHGRGFQFVAELTTVSPERPESLPKIKSSNSDIAISVVVSSNIDASSKIIPVATDIAMGIEVMLSRIPLLKIRAQGSLSNGCESMSAEPLPTAKAMYVETGVQYIVFLTVQQGESVNRVNVQLVDAETELIIWSHLFKQPAVEAGDTIQTFVTHIVAKFEPQLTKAIYERVKGAGDNADDAEHSSAQALFLQASTLLSVKGWHANTFLEAAELLKRSEALDANFALAPAYLALVLALGHRIGLLADSEQNIAEAMAAVDRAIALDNSDSMVLGYCGCALSDVGMFARAKSMLRKALKINENNAQAWVALGSAHLFQGEIEQAIEHLSHGIAISPLDNRLSMWGAVLASAHLRAKNFEQALVACEMACDSDDNAYLPRVILAAVYIAMGRHDAVVETMADAYRIKPDLSAFEISQLVGHKLGQQLQEVAI